MGPAIFRGRSGKGDIAFSAGACGAGAAGLFAADGRELEFIVRTLVELKLQIEELRSRVHDISAMPSPIARESSAVVNDLGVSDSRVTVGNGREFPDHMAVSPRYGAIEAPGQLPPLATVTIAPGMTMAEIEKLAISAALAATKGNRRKAAEMLGIGERTMYRKLREYGIPVR